MIMKLNPLEKKKDINKRWTHLIKSEPSSIK